MEPPPGIANAFTRMPGEGWHIVYEGRSLRLPEMKGLHYIACLLARPGEPVHVCDLTGRESRGERSHPPEAVAIERARKAVGNRIRETIDRIAARDGELGLHLERAIRMGRECTYAPGRTVPWAL